MSAFMTSIYLLIAIFFFVMAYVENEKAKVRRERIIAEAKRRARYKEDVERCARIQRMMNEIAKRTAQQHAPWWCDVLGVSPTATSAQINTAYKTKAKRAHPDRGGSEDAMKRLNIAKDAALKARIAS